MRQITILLLAGVQLLICKNIIGLLHSTLARNGAPGGNATEKPDPYFCSIFKGLQKYGSGFSVAFFPKDLLRLKVDQ